MAKKRRFLLTLFLCLTGTGLAGLHLSDPLWYDEIWTVINYALPGALHPLTHYQEPNNHVLFSAVLSLWMSLWGEFSDIQLRFLPFLCYLVSIAFLAGGAMRLGGETCAAITGLLFTTAHVTNNFAVQLRGYGPSWLPVCAGFWLLSRDPRLRHNGTVVSVIACGALAVGILPTNLTPFLALAAWVSAAAWLARRNTQASAAARKPKKAGKKSLPLTRLALLWSAPFWGGLFYLGIWRFVLEKGKSFTAETSAITLATAWLTSFDALWLMPVAAAGAFFAWRAHRLSREGLLLACSVCVPAVCVLCMPQTPFPRNFVPLFPLVCAGAGQLCAFGLRKLSVRLRLAASRRMVRNVLAAAVCLGLLVPGVLREKSGADYARRFAPTDKPQNLYDQYYHAPLFRPDLAVEAMRTIQERSPGLWLADESDHVAVWWSQAYRIQPGEPEILYWKKKVVPALLAAQPGPAYLITRSRENADMLRQQNGFRADIPPEADTGFFRIYRVR